VKAPLTAQTRSLKDWSTKSSKQGGHDMKKENGKRVTEMWCDVCQYSVDHEFQGYGEGWICKGCKNQIFSKLFADKLDLGIS
jgi:hypothetical protein